MMTTLKDALVEAGIDASSLAVLWENDPERIYVLSVSGAEAIQSWQRLRALVSLTGYWPVLLGDEQNLKHYREGLEDIDPGSAREVIEKGLLLDADALLQRWEAEQRADADEEWSEDNLHGDWPDGDHAACKFIIPLDFSTDAPKPTIFLGLIPTQHCWEVPAFLGFGGWNDCPFPEEHVCFMKRWQERYGAEVVGVTLDVIEMHVARPPKTREDALRLAAEQSAYCSEMVGLGDDTLEDVAATLLNGTVWYFWWD